jgi:hypothetical protein
MREISFVNFLDAPIVTSKARVYPATKKHINNKFEERNFEVSHKVIHVNILQEMCKGWTQD